MSWRALYSINISPYDIYELNERLELLIYISYQYLQLLQTIDIQTTKYCPGYQATATNPKTIAAINAQRLCPTSNVPAPLPAGVTVAEPEPLARDPEAPLCAADAADDAAEAAEEAADERALDADALIEEKAEEATAEIEEATSDGTLL